MPWIVNILVEEHSGGKFIEHRLGELMNLEMHDSRGYDIEDTLFYEF